MSKDCETKKTLGSSSLEISVFVYWFSEENKKANANVSRLGAYTCITKIQLNCTRPPFCTMFYTFFFIFLAFNMALCTFKNPCQILPCRRLYPLLDILKIVVLQIRSRLLRSPRL